MEPNIFKFPYTESVQDAFIAWMCECFNSNNEHKKKISELFIKDLLGVDIDFKRVKVEQQVKNIDILLTLDTDSEKEVNVIIEDKTDSCLHDDQLQKYVDKLDKRNQIYVVYYKTGHVNEIANTVFFDKDGYHFEPSIKSEASQALGTLNVHKSKICKIKDIHDFFSQKNVMDSIRICHSEILEDYVESIKYQYNSYYSNKVNRRDSKNIIWGRIFEDLIKQAGKVFPDLLFANLAFYQGQYWEIYVTRRIPENQNPESNRSNNLFTEPILNIRSDLFALKTPTIHFFHLPKEEKEGKYRNLRFNSKSQSYTLLFGRFKNTDLNYRSFQEDNINIEDILLLFQAICEEFNRLVIMGEEDPFELHLHDS